MAEPPSLHPLEIFADLRMTVESGAGVATAHLHGNTDELVLDVDHPAVLARLTPGRPGRSPLTRTLQQLVPDTPVHIRSRGRTLARVRLSSGGAVRIRPTAAGLLTAVGAELAEHRIRTLAIATGSVLAGLLARRTVAQRFRAGR